MDAGRGSSVDAASYLDALYAAHYLAMVRLAVQLVDDPETAEDVVQDVFAALQSRAEPPDDPPRYLRSSVLNRCRSALRRRRVARAFLLARPGSAEPADERSLRDAEHHRVLAAVDRLPRRQREVVILHYYEDLAIAEIAATLGISPGAVSSSLSRALANLHSTVGDTDA
jgi:RNA polymerase sigma-70 factor (sigma-E family)